MFQSNRIISFGASITTGAGAGGINSAWSSIIAKKLNKSYLCLAEVGATNTTIARKIISTEFSPNDTVLVMWVSTTRFEFWLEDQWIRFTPWSDQLGFVKDWYRGPGQWEYTGVSTALKEIYLAQSYLKSQNIPYLFTIDNNEVHKSWLLENDTGYIKSLSRLIDWSKFIFFDGQGFIPWCQEKQFSLSTDGHPGAEAHQAAAECILDSNVINC